MAGYSGTPLPKKLGIKEGHRVLLQCAHGFSLDGLPPRTRSTTRRSTRARYDVILAFCRDKKALAALLPRCLAVLPSGGALWLCWPKKSSGVKTDIVSADVRHAGLTSGVVDVKVCAIDETWSGLKFVVRVEARAGWR